MATEEYQVGYEAGYQDGWNAAQQAEAVPLLSDAEIEAVMRQLGWTGQSPDDLKYARLIEQAVRSKLNLKD